MKKYLILSLLFMTSCFDSESDKSDSVEEVNTCEAFCSLCDESAACLDECGDSCCETEISALTSCQEAATPECDEDGLVIDLDAEECEAEVTALLACEILFMTVADVPELAEQECDLESTPTIELCTTCGTGTYGPPNGTFVDCYASMQPTEEGCADEMNAYTECANANCAEDISEVCSIEETALMWCGLEHSG